MHIWSKTIKFYAARHGNKKMYKQRSAADKHRKMFEGNENKFPRQRRWVRESVCMCVCCIKYCFMWCADFDFEKTRGNLMNEASNDCSWTVPEKVLIMKPARKSTNEDWWRVQMVRVYHNLLSEVSESIRKCDPHSEQNKTQETHTHTHTDRHTQR